MNSRDFLVFECGMENGKPMIPGRFGIPLAEEMVEYLAPKVDQFVQESEIHMLQEKVDHWKLDIKIGKSRDFGWAIANLEASIRRLKGGLRERSK